MKQHAPSATHGEDEPMPGRWVAMATLLIASFMNLIDVTIVNVALPSLQKAFGATSSQIEWVVAAYILVFGLGLLPFGRLGDIVGKRKLFVMGLAVFTLGSLFCGLAPSINWLIAARVVQGIGGAMMTPQTLAIVPVIMPPNERGAAYALFGLSAGLAAVSGPILGGFLIEANINDLGWRTIFLVNIPVGIFAMFAAVKFIPYLKGNSDLKNDFVGIIIAASMLFLLIFPLLEGRSYGWPMWTFVMMAAALPMAILFGWWLARQARLGKPQLLPVSLLKNRNYMIGSALATILFSNIPGFFLIFAVYLQTGYGLSPLHSGLTTVPFSVGVLVSSIISGKMGLYFPRRRITAGALLLFLAMLWLSFLVGKVEPDIVWLHFAPPLFIGGLGLGTAISPMFQTVLSNVQARDIGSGSGALQSFQQLGGAFGVAIIAEIFFSKIQTGMAELASKGGDPHAVFSSAVTHALIYNLIAFALVAVMVRLLPKPGKDGAAATAPVIID